MLDAVSAGRQVCRCGVLFIPSCQTYYTATERRSGVAGRVGTCVHRWTRACANLLRWHTETFSVMPPPLVSNLHNTKLIPTIGNTCVILHRILCGPLTHSVAHISDGWQLADGWRKVVYARPRVCVCFGVVYGVHDAARAGAASFAARTRERTANIFILCEHVCVYVLVCVCV